MNKLVAGMATKTNCSRVAKDAWKTRKSPVYRAKKSEAAGKVALSIWAAENGWKIVFFEGKRGGPRTGIVDAVLIRIAPKRPDVLQLRLVQLKSGTAGFKPSEVKRLKEAVTNLQTNWYFAGFDGKDLYWSAEVQPGD
jgi:hypothetical protein